MNITQDYQVITLRRVRLIRHKFPVDIFAKNYNAPTFNATILFPSMTSLGAMPRGFTSGMFDFFMAHLCTVINSNPSEWEGFIPQTKTFPKEKLTDASEPWAFANANIIVPYYRNHRYNNHGDPLMVPDPSRLAPLPYIRATSALDPGGFDVPLNTPLLCDVTLEILPRLIDNHRVIMFNIKNITEWT